MAYIYVIINTKIVPISPTGEQVMNNAQFKEACAIAFSDEDLSQVNDDILFGFGLPEFKPIVTNLRTVAKTIRWQSQQLNGEIDNEALNQCKTLMRHKVSIIP